MRDAIVSFYFLNKRKVHGYAAIFFVVASLAIVFWSRGSSAQNSLVAQRALELWKKNPSDLQCQREMRCALKKAPALNWAVQSEIAQTLLTNGQVGEAVPIAASCIERLREDAPLHAAFAETSLLIEQGKYQRALEASVALKEKMEDARSPLYAWNLLRIAFLQKGLGNAPGEAFAWEEVKAFLAEPGAFGAKLLEANFGAGKFGLADFIAKREGALALSQ